MMFDLQNKLAPVQVLTSTDVGAAGANATTNTKAVPMQGAKACVFIINAGAATGGDANNYVSPQLQECAAPGTTSASYTNVASADYSEVPTGQSVSSTSNLPTPLSLSGEVRLVGYIGAQPYVRMQFTTVTPGGGTAITHQTMTVAAILGRLDQLPTSNQSATVTQPQAGAGGTAAADLYPGFAPPAAITPS